jgi:cytoskeletal protein CcmA (bactofilin family)
MLRVTKCLETIAPQSQHRKDELRGYIAEGSEIDGTYAFTGTVMLNGKFKGEIQSSDILIIGEKGIVNANINVGTVLISGEVMGNVLATERIELRGTARVFGDIEARGLRGPLPDDQGAPVRGQRSPRRARAVRCELKR